MLEKSRELGASGEHLAAIRKKIYEDQDALIELSSKLGIILPGEPFGKMKQRYNSRRWIKTSFFFRVGFFFFVYHFEINKDIPPNRNTMLKDKLIAVAEDYIKLCDEMKEAGKSFKDFVKVKATKENMEKTIKHLCLALKDEGCDKKEIVAMVPSLAAFPTLFN